ncbi:acyl-CoA thioesterase II [Sphingobium sp. 15-1]|uniref:acyl-CoA thioesterase n=1 Tax=Sphingobium sp. 15-1 TaxID=2729616 RepID=UPI00159C7D19|nr:acyl-CoA thioesterase domain-containing protein [Sphingobium sp. 15-1]
MTPFPRWDGLDILAPIAVEPVGQDRFSNRVAQTNTFGWMFGGQCMGLAMAAACRTVDDMLVHAASGFFLRRGPVNQATRIQVTRTFDGGSFCARDVALITQNEAIFRAQASFQRPEVGPAYSDAMPDVEPPQRLLNLQQLQESGDHRIISGLARRISVPKSVDLRPISPRGYATGEEAGSRAAWMRIPSLPSICQNEQHALLAYLSDYWLAGTAANRQEPESIGTRLLMSSLNQTIWYFGAFDLADWVLFKASAPVAASGRAIARTDVFTRSGALIASTVQEVLIRETNAPRACASL